MTKRHKSEHSKSSDFYPEGVNIGRNWYIISKIQKILNVNGTLKFTVLFYHILSKWTWAYHKIEALNSVFLRSNPGLSWLNHSFWKPHDMMDRLWVGKKKKKKPKRISETPLPNKWSGTTEQ